MSDDVSVGSAAIFAVFVAFLGFMAGIWLGLKPTPPRHIQSGRTHTVVAGCGVGESCESQMLRICPRGYRLLHHRPNWECVFECEETSK